MMDKKYKKYILLIVILSITIKILFLFGSGTYQNLQPFEYEEISKNLLEGNGFYYNSHFGVRYYASEVPGYPLLCYVIYKLFGHNMLWVIFIQIFVTSLLVIPIYFIASYIFTEKTAILAASLCAIQPQLIIYSTEKLHSLNIYAFLFALLVLCFLMVRRSPTLKNIVFVGFAAGISILFRITIISFVFLGIIWFFITSNYEKTKKIKAALLIIFIAGILILPWVIRNYIVYNKPIFLQTNDWQSIWYGNMPGSAGSLYAADGQIIFEKAKASLRQDFSEMNEIEIGNYLKNLTIGYFNEDPIGFLTRIFKKIYYFWYFSPYQGSWYPRLWMTLYKIYYMFILLPALYSLGYNLFFKKDSDKTDILLIMLLFVALTGVHSLAFVEARHRWAVESLLLVFTANGLIAIKDGIKNMAKR